MLHRYYSIAKGQIQTTQFKIFREEKYLTMLNGIFFHAQVCAAGDMICQSYMKMGEPHPFISITLKGN